MFIKNSNGITIDYTKITDNIINSKLLDNITIFMTIFIVLFTIIAYILLYFKPSYIIDKDIKHADTNQILYTKVIFISILISVPISYIILYYCYMCKK